MSCLFCDFFCFWLSRWGFYYRLCFNGKILCVLMMIFYVVFLLRYFFPFFYRVFLNVYNWSMINMFIITMGRVSLWGMVVRILWVRWLRWRSRIRGRKMWLLLGIDLMRCWLRWSRVKGGIRLLCILLSGRCWRMGLILKNYRLLRVFNSGTPISTKTAIY